MSLTSRASVRSLVAAAALGATLALGGCGFDAQTLQPYTPAQGVNAQQGDLYMRNLLVYADGSGAGQLSGQFSTRTKADTLASVSGVALKAHGEDGAALTVNGGNVAIPQGKAVQVGMTGQPAIQVSSTDLKPGLTARLELTFASGIKQTIVVPVTDATHSYYKTISPAAATPSATPSK